MIIRGLGLLAVFVLTIPALSSSPATHPAATGASAPAETDPNALVLLKALEATGQAYRTILADVQLLVDFRDVGDTEARAGSVVYLRGEANEPARFRISFDTLKQGDGPAIKDPVEYTYDGQWLSVLRHKLKQMERIQVAAEGEKVEPLKIGKGPFPLPFGQKADEVLKYFDVSTRPATGKDPNGTEYLRLVRRDSARGEINFSTLEMWMDRATRLPVKLISEERKGKEVTKATTAEFRNVQTNKEVKDIVFSPQRPAGWELNVKRLGER